jgi:LmbE family N-acetylglucosaminyl deacetylase
VAIPTTSRTAPRSLKSLLRPLKELVRATFEGLWRAVFFLRGRWPNDPVRRWSSPGGERVLVIAPHPDDETIGCGGTLLAHVAAGDEVRVLFVTDGRRSRALGLAPGEMAGRRKSEAQGAVEALGLSGMTWLGLPEGEWQLAQVEPRLAQVLTSFRPAIVYVPSRIDFHPEHVRTAWALGAVVEGSLPSGAQMRIYSSQVPLTSILVNLVHGGVSETALVSVLSSYVTQAATLKQGLRHGRYAAAYHGASGRAEEFWELSPRAYAALHVGKPPAEPWRFFRGIGPETWSDPLAFLVGRRARHRAGRRVASVA